MEKSSVFEYLDFRKYLAFRLAPYGSSRGLRTQLAELLRVQPSYISKIIAGDIRLPSEHILPMNRLLEHNDLEAEFFFYLVEYTQAGTHELQKFFRVKLNELLEKRWSKADWIQNKNEIPDQLQAQYLSEWYYSVIHVLTRIPQFQTKTAISERLNLSLGTVAKALDFLVKAELCKVRGDRYQMTSQRIHFDKKSPWISHYHNIIRQIVLRSYTDPKPEQKRYSFVMGISHTDQQKIQNLLQQTIEEIEKIVEKSSDEDVCIFSMDFFTI